MPESGRTGCLMAVFTERGKHNVNTSNEIAAEAKEETQRLIDFIAQSPSCYHVVQNIGSELQKAGYKQLSEGQDWELAESGKYYVTRNQSSLIAFQMNAAGKQGGFLICAAHSDSPTFKLKSNYEVTVENKYVKLNVEKYGGSIHSTWMDRPLSIAGRVVVSTEGGVESRLVDLKKPLCVIPNLAVHMNREINNGYAYQLQKDMVPVMGTAGESGQLLKMLAREAGVEETDILGHDLFLYHAETGKIWGLGEEFFSSGKIDDLQCVFAAKEAFLRSCNQEMVPVLAIFDNEEVGSGTKQGAKSTFLTDVLERIQESLHLNRGKGMQQIASSMMLSADNGHAVHPNHGDKADATNAPVMNGGIVIKYNANQKYTTDGMAEAMLKQIWKKAQIPYQEYANRSDIAGGSTLGNLVNEKLSLNTVDIGAAQLAMHSIYETGGTADTLYLIEGMQAFYHSRIENEADGHYRIS